MVLPRIEIVDIGLSYHRKTGLQLQYFQRFSTLYLRQFSKNHPALSNTDILATWRTLGALM